VEPILRAPDESGQIGRFDASPGQEAELALAQA
jgi:hypothetical protein